MLVFLTNFSFSDDETAGKVGITSRLSRVERQVFCKHLFQISDLELDQKGNVMLSRYLLSSLK